MDITSGYPSKLIGSAGTEVSENLDEIEALLRRLLANQTKGEELALQSATSQLVTELLEGVRHPGKARITVVFDDEPTSASPSAIAAIGPGPMAAPAAIPAPVVPAAPSIEETYGKRLLALTADPDEGLRIVESVMRLGVRSADEVTKAVQAFQPIIGSRQYDGLIAYTAQVATTVAAGTDQVHTTSTGKPYLKTTRKLQDDVNVVQSTLTDVVSVVFAGSPPAFSSTSDMLSRTRKVIADLHNEIVLFEQEIAVHSGLGRDTLNNETVVAYVDRVVKHLAAKPSTTTPLPVVGSFDLNALGKALGVTRKSSDTNDDTYAKRIIAEVTDKISTVRAEIVRIATINGVTFKQDDGTIVILHELIDSQRGVFSSRLQR